MLNSAGSKQGLRSSRCYFLCSRCYFPNCNHCAANSRQDLCDLKCYFRSSRYSESHAMCFFRKRIY